MKLNLQNSSGEFYLCDIVKKRLIANKNKVTWSSGELSSGVVLNIPPQERVILTMVRNRPDGMNVFSDADRQSELKSINKKEQSRVAVLLDQVRAKRLADAEARIHRGVKKNKCVPVDLKKHANMEFRDEVAGDRKGGWFDQGANDFSHIPLGKQVFAGVPFEIIDPAQNGGKSVIVMAGTERSYFPEKTAPVLVGRKAKYINFLHTMGWNDKNKAVAVYRINYSDGTFTDIELFSGKEIGSWWGAPKLSRAKIAVESYNTQKDLINMQCFRWKNPVPDKTVESIVIRSTGTAASIAVAAITVEQP